MKKALFKFLAKILDAEIVPKNIEKSGSATTRFHEQSHRYFSIFEFVGWVLELKESGYLIDGIVGEKEDIPIDHHVNLSGSLHGDYKIFKKIFSAIDTQAEIKRSFSDPDIEFMYGVRYLPIRLELFTKDGLPVFFSFYKQKITTTKKVVNPCDDPSGKDCGNNSSEGGFEANHNDLFYSPN